MQLVTGTVIEGKVVLEGASLPRVNHGAQLASSGAHLPVSPHQSYRLAMSQLERITVDPSVRFGKPCVRGTRLTVGDVLGYLAGGMTEAEVLADFPQLTHEDILACLAFAAERERRLVSIPTA